MHEEQPKQTRYTLIERAVSKNDEEAWKELLQIYRNFLFFLVRKLNVSENDQDDIVQLISIKLSNKLSTYNKDIGTFRSWLGQITRNEVFLYFRKQRTNKESLNRTLSEKDQWIEPYSEPEIQAIIDKQWRNYITNLALDKLQEKFPGNSIEIFKLSAQGEDTDSIANKLGVTKDSIYTLRNRIKKQLIVEVKQLILEIEGENSHEVRQA